MNLENIFCTGRCISGSFRAHASYLVTGICMGMGQGVGLAAAYGVKNHINSSAVPGSRIKELLIERGAFFIKNKNTRLYSTGFTLAEN